MQNQSCLQQSILLISHDSWQILFVHDFLDSIDMCSLEFVIDLNCEMIRFPPAWQRDVGVGIGASISARKYLKLTARWTFKTAYLLGKFLNERQHYLCWNYYLHKLESLICVCQNFNFIFVYKTSLYDSVKSSAFFITAEVCFLFFQFCTSLKILLANLLVVLLGTEFIELVS